MSPIAGRTFPGDGSAAEPLVVLSETAWRQHLSSDPSAVGRAVRINGIAHTVIGIMPRSFDYPERTHVWILSPQPVPSRSIDAPGDLLTNRDLRYFYGVARVKPGVTRAQAQADLATIAQDLAERFPQTNARRGIAPATFLVAALALVATALVASYVPSRRTLNVDPLTALRAE